MKQSILGLKKEQSESMESSQPQPDKKSALSEEQSPATLNLDGTLQIAQASNEIIQLKDFLQLAEQSNSVLNYDFSTSGDTQKVEDSNKSDDNDLSNEGNGDAFLISRNTNNHNKVESIARVLDLHENAHSFTDNPSNQQQITISGFDLNSTFNVGDLSYLQLQNDIYYLPKVGSKVTTESTQQLAFDHLLAGVILPANSVIGQNVTLNVSNFAGGPNIATVINSTDHLNGVQNLQSPWPKGNLSNQSTDPNILVIAKNNTDQDEDGLIDNPLPQNGATPGNMTFNFDSPVYEFGWDIFNLEYGPELSYGQITFYDLHGLSTTVPFGSFIDPNSPFYDSSLVFGSHSANRITPINAQDIGLDEIASITMTIPDSVGINKIHTTTQDIRLLPNQKAGNFLQNDAIDLQETLLQSISFEFDSSGEAQQFMQDNVALVGNQSGTSVIVSDFNQIIPTPLGGQLHVEPNGDFHYTAPIDFTHGAKTEEISYQVEDANGLTGRGDFKIILQDNLPLANSNENYINTGNGSHLYNLVLMLDISGSMSTQLYDRSRLEMAKEALVQLIEFYDAIGQELNITIIPFGSGDILDGAFSYHATSVEDARDFIMQTNAHAIDGIHVGMINPDTGQPIDTDTHYDHALYHARVTLENDITDPNLSDYEHVVYFLSDGRPFIAHSATDQGDWPSHWGSWLDFINHTQSEIPQSQVDSIKTFTVAVDPDEDIQAYLVPIATDDEHMFEPDSNLLTFSKELLQTLPEFISGEVLSNDFTYSIDAQLTEISFFVDDATQYITQQNLAQYGAHASADNQTVSIPLPQDGSKISFISPLDGMMVVDSNGHYLYVPGEVSQEATDLFAYTLYDDILNAYSQADLQIHVYPQESSVIRAVGDHVDNHFSTTNQSGIIYFEGGRGVDDFTIDFSNENVPLIYIKDLTNAQPNHIIFSHVQDQNQDSIIDLADVIDGFFQQHENANVYVHLNNANAATQFAGTDLVLENIGTVVGTQVDDLIDYLNALALQISFV